jgi:hypothetical protein
MRSSSLYASQLLLHGAREAQYFLRHATEMLLFISRQQILSCTCQPDCTLSILARPRPQHRHSVSQSPAQRAAVPVGLPAGGSGLRAARSTFCSRPRHTAKQPRRWSTLHATSYDGGVARPARAVDDSDADELTPLDGEKQRHTESAAAATPVALVGMEPLSEPCRMARRCSAYIIRNPTGHVHTSWTWVSQAHGGMRPGAQERSTCGCRLRGERS